DHNSDKHCRLSILRVKEQTLNQKLHSNCDAGCPVYGIKVCTEEFCFTAIQLCLCLVFVA
ncbi:hypothetical protein PSHT_16367, partial [Puccinia striiformis]